MRALIQRVKWAQVEIEGRRVGRIEQGLLTLLGVVAGDTDAQLEKMITRIGDLRVFEDSDGKMNRSLRDIQGGHLIVSQFTLAADCAQGRRPSFGKAEKPERARELYERSIVLSRGMGLETQSGEFGAMMQVSLQNDGPATFWLEV